MLSRQLFIGHEPACLNLRAVRTAWGRGLPVAALLWLGVQAANAAPGSAASTTAVPPLAAAEAEGALLTAINDYRAAKGLRRWQPDPGLAAIARGHSQSMAGQGQLSHEGFNQRAVLTGSSVCVENLLQGKVTPTQAVALWQRSAEHRANLLDRDAAWAGIGVEGRFVTLLACATPAAPAPLR